MGTGKLGTSLALLLLCFWSSRPRKLKVKCLFLQVKQISNFMLLSD